MSAILITIISSVSISLINFIGIKIYNYVNGTSKSFIWKEKGKKLNDLKYSTSIDEIKKRVRIVVIDDEDSFPITLFQDEGYAIDKWEKVKDYGKLESGFYDIIVLDIKGVAIEFSENDGLGILESIKQKNPAQIIIAYSQHSFDLSKANFWLMADEKIAKPSDFLKIKAKIDDLINTKFKPERYIDALRHYLQENSFSANEIDKFDRTLAKNIEQRTPTDWNKVLDFANKKTSTISQVITLGNTILKFFS